MSDQTMQSDVYKAPESNVMREEAEGEYDESSMFKPSGRAGRLRYFKYGMALSMGGILAAIALAAIVSALSEDVDAVMLGVITNAAFVLLLPISIIFVIKRFHDLGWSGWWSLTIFIPLLNLIPTCLLLFMPGTSGANRFGNPTRPGNSGVVWLIAILVLVMTIGILAAIAVPAYNDYLQAAGEAGATQQ